MQKNKTLKLPEKQNDVAQVAQHPFFRQLEIYLSNLKRQGRSEHTIAAYRRDLLQLVPLLPLIEQPHRRDFLNALKRLSQKNLSERSLARILSAWRQYAAFLLEKGLLQQNPLEGLKAPRPKERLPKALDQEMLNHLLDTDETEDSLSIRDHAIFELMYGSGLRVSEVCSLNLNDISLQNGWVHIKGKGDKQRQVPLTRKSIEAIQAYLQERTPPKDGQALFTGRFGTRLGRNQIGKRLKHWSQHNGSTQHISPHMLRHSYASHLLQSSRDIRAVQELLGHSQLSTTQIYTKLDFDHLARAYDEAHPRAKRKKQVNQEKDNTTEN